MRASSIVHNLQKESKRFLQLQLKHVFVVQLKIQVSWIYCSNFSIPINFNFNQRYLSTFFFIIFQLNYLIFYQLQILTYGPLYQLLRFMIFHQNNINCYFITFFFIVLILSQHSFHFSDFIKPFLILLAFDNFNIIVLFQVLKFKYNFKWFDNAKIIKFKNYYNLIRLKSIRKVRSLQNKIKTRLNTVKNYMDQATLNSSKSQKTNKKIQIQNENSKTQRNNNSSQLKNVTKSLNKTSSLGKSISSFQFSTPKSSRYLKDTQIISLSEKLNDISKSINLSLYKNPLRLVQYQMAGQRQKHDPQMILAKLRKLQNRAQIHRAQAQITLIQAQHQSNRKKSPLRRFIKNRNRILQPQIGFPGIMTNKKTKKNAYLNIYQMYKQQQQERQKQQMFKQSEQNNQQKNQQFETQTKDGIKFYGLLKKHPKLIDYTLFKKKIHFGVLQQEKQLQRKRNFKKQVKQSNGEKDYEKQINIQKTKQIMNEIPNPQKIIQKQISKFYLKKNPGRIQKQTTTNPRSLKLIQMQNKLSYQIGDIKISKQDRKKLRQKFNDLANQLSRSDRRNSLQSVKSSLLQKKQQINMRSSSISNKKSELNNFSYLLPRN